MTNHVRTLLLNLRALPSGTALPGEEYVPADYVPARLPAALAAAREALFGPGADRAGMNLNLARLLTFLHASTLAPHATTADARLTYDPARVADVWDDLGAAATTRAGLDAVAWGGAQTFPAAGRAYGVWTLTADGAGAYALAPDATNQARPVVPSSAGDALPIPETDLALVVPTAAAGSWRVTLLVAPPYAFDRADAAGDPAAVFRPARSAAERAWYAAWNGEPLAAHRAAAFALALAARVADVRAGVAYEAPL